MMSPRWVLLPASFLLLPVIACISESPSAQNSAVVRAVDSRLSASLEALHVGPGLGLTKGQSIDDALGAPFKHPFDVVLNDPQRTHKTVDTCRDYLPIEDSIYSAGSQVMLNGLRSYGARCDALDLLKSARPSVHSSFGDRPLEKISAQDLPPGLEMIVAREQQASVAAATKAGKSILAVEPSATLKPTSSDEAELNAKNWTATITIYARADFLGDGNEELLIERAAAAREGTYSSDKVYLLSRSSSNAVLRIVTERPRS